MKSSLPCFWMGKILEIDLRINLYRTPEKNIFIRYIPNFFFF
ncbi:hypothetical protein [Leptospira kirschneri]|nr:hypothetical protein [Leptospira kirschneri]